MNQGLLQDIRKNMDSKSTEELIRIWKENDKRLYSEEAFEAIRQILDERGEKNIPQLPTIPTRKEHYKSESEISFEVSERFKTNMDSLSILTILEKQFGRVANKVIRKEDELIVKDIEASFGSINRSDHATIRLVKKDYGYLCIAEVVYRTSFAFWIILIVLFFTAIFWFIPIIFYLTQKKTVREAIEKVLKRVKDEVED